MLTLHAQLDRAGTENIVLAGPTSAVLRDELLEFGGSRRAIIFCGDAVPSGKDVFVGGNGDILRGDLALSAVSVRAFSRVVGTGGAVVLDLHPGIAASSQALTKSAANWMHDTGLPAAKFAVVEQSPGAATMIQRLVQSDTTNIAKVVGVFTKPSTDVMRSPPEIGTETSSAAAPAIEKVAPPAPAPVPPILSTDLSPRSTPVPSPTKVGSSEKPVTSEMPTSPSITASQRIEPLITEKTSVRKKTRQPSSNRQSIDHQRSQQAVRNLQVALLAHGAYFGRVDGRSGPELYDAIRRFQMQNGFKSTGALTPQEVKLLEHG